MAQCKQTAQEFIQSTFSPHMAVSCSADAELLCQKNNLSFVELVQPFCRLTTEAHIRDPGNMPHTIHNLRMTMIDMNSHPPSPAMARKMMSDTVNNSQPQMTEGNRANVLSIGNYDLQLSASTPWYDAYRECFLQTLPPTDHEFLRHCLGCLFVVSSTHTDPIGMFHTLASSQQQQQMQFPNKLPRWFCPNVLKYYVLLHDVVEGEQAKADAIYQSMKSSFGHQVCHLLQVNSRSLTTAENMKGDSNLPDPWSQFISKPPEHSEGVDYEASSSGVVDDATFPSKLVEGDTDSGLMTLDSVSEATEGSIGVDSITTSEVFDHPLAMPDQNSIHSNNINDFSSESLGSTMSMNSDTSSVSKSTTFTLEKAKHSRHGQCLTTSDHDRLRIFIHEFAVRALIPWGERQMKVLNEQFASRTGIRKSIFSATKKWFGSNKPTHGPSVQNTTVVYTTEAPELQMRRLADLSFLFQMYEFAYQNYHTAKRDFNNDHAWLHYAGALEMTAISIFMQGTSSQRAYPYNYMDSAITTYIQSCKNPSYAARATLVSTECLKSRGMYQEAATQFIKMMSEDSDLRSALLLEQAAHCFINIKSPMVRKYSFHMILAGHRFSKSGQRKHALRSYSQALQVYKGKNWSLAEDHINFTIGRQSHNLKQLENATAAFKHLLKENSKQTASQQNAFLREYLFVYKQMLAQEVTENGMLSSILPELPLPVLDCNATKVLLGSRPQPPQDEKVPASGVWFDQGEVDNSKWCKLEELLVASASGGYLPVTHRPTLQCYSSRTENKYNPVGFVREPITVEIFLVNPLKETILLTDVALLWSFVPAVASHEKPQTITNEQTSSVKNSLADEIVHNQVVEDVILQGSAKIPLQLTLIPQQMGDLRIVGVAYNLGSSAPGFSTPPQANLMGGGGVAGGTKASYVSTVFVRGKQRLEVQGPRLNSKKEEMASKTYGPDRRLDIVVQQEMPLLQVSFCNFPKTLLCGEVHPITIQFTNLGSSPLHRLKVASNNPKFFTFGYHGDLPNHSVYHTDSCANVDSGKCDCVTYGGIVPTVNRVMDICIPGGTLQPKSTVSVRAWIRGDDIGGIHEVDFLFYYEPALHLSRTRHRLLRHTALINTLESLSVRAIARRGSRTSAGHMVQQPDTCVISCEMENLSQMQVQKSYVKEIHVTQISCASQQWLLKCLSAQSKHDIQIGNRETLQVCLKGDRQKPGGADESVPSETSLSFSDISFTSQKIVSCKVPCSDFYFCSQVRLKPLEEENVMPETPAVEAVKTVVTPLFGNLNCAIELGMTLIILWQAHVIDESGKSSTCVGQHHVTLDRIDTIFTSYPYLQIAQEQKPLRFTRSDESVEDVRPPSEVITQLVNYSFKHQTKVSHSFSKCRVCSVPVSVVLQNCSNSSITVLIDTSDAQQRLSEPQEVSSSVTDNVETSGFTWASQTLTEFQLDVRQRREITLRACFGKAGLFNVNNLAVFVTYEKDSSEMTLQKQNTPSIIVISDGS